MLNTHCFEDLLGEIMIDEGGLKSEVPGGVDAGALLLRGFGGSFTHGKKVCEKTNIEPRSM